MIDYASEHGVAVLGGFSAMSHPEELVPISGAGPLAPELMARVEMAWRSNFGFAGPPLQPGAVKRMEEACLPVTPAA